MRVVRVVAWAAVLAVYAAAADVKLELHLKRAVPEHVIEQEFAERSTPGTSKFRQHLTVQQLAELVRPRSGAAAAVRRFLAGTQGATERGQFVTGDVVLASVSTGSAAAAALGVTAEGVEASVPKSLAPYVARIVVEPAHPLVRHDGARPNEAANTTAATRQWPGEEQNPLKIYGRYQVPNTTVPSSTVQGVAEFNVPMGFSQGAMDAFNVHYGLPKTQVLISGENPATQAWTASEGQLDVEYISALAPGATTWWISANATSTWTQWCDQVMGLSPLPAVVSISWGEGEFNFLPSTGTIPFSPETTTTTTAAPTAQPYTPVALTAANDAFRKLGLLGITVLASSGDSGPSSWGPNTLFGVLCSNKFGPQFPASSPYVTAVGATYSNTSAMPEVAVSWSGGGFSEFFPTPSWQKAAVKAYLTATNATLPPATMFNASGRAYPDVAALGTNFAVEGNFSMHNANGSALGDADAWSAVSGTSASSPTFAGIITRIVAKRVAAGKTTLGFLNPSLYRLGRVGQDVTEGKNGNGCFPSTVTTPPANDPGYGFPTAVGWDPVTGLGTPSYPFLEANLA